MGEYSLQDCPGRIVCSSSAVCCYLNNSSPDVLGVQRLALLLALGTWLFSEGLLCVHPNLEVSLSLFLSDISTSPTWGRLTCSLLFWEIVVWRGFWGSASKILKAQPSSVLSRWLTHGDFACLNQAGKKGRQLSSWWPLFQPTLVLFFLPSHAGASGACSSHGSVTSRQVLSLGNRRRNGLLHFELVGREWENTSNGPIFFS